MRKITIGFLILGVFCFGMFPAHAEEGPLKVKISLGQSSVKSGMMFLVAARVSSRSGSPVSMRCHSCAFEKQWTVDTPNVFLQPWTCHEDSVEKVTVDATKSYEKNLILYVTKTDETGPVTFRLGFTHVLKDGDEMEPVWSNPVTLEVVVPDLPVLKSTEAGSGNDQSQPSTIELSDSMPDEASDASDEDADRGTS